MRVTTSHRDAVRISDVTVGYKVGEPVMTGLDLTIPSTGITHLTGSNGSGKSTLIELCSGYLRPWSGTVELAGLPAASPTARDRRRVCRTRAALYPNMTVRDHLIFASRCRQVSPDPALERTERFGLGDWLDENARALSTGNARKLWFVMCTVGDFEVALLDEPFNGIDAAGVATCLDEIEEWAQRGSVVIASHVLPPRLAADTEIDLDEVRTASARGVIVAGRPGSTS